MSLAWGDAWRLDTGFPTSGRRVRWCVAIFRFRKVNKKLRFVLQYGLVFKNKHIIDHRGGEQGVEMYELSQESLIFTVTRNYQNHILNIS